MPTPSDRRTVVIIDDSELVLELVGETLGGAGWTCIAARDALSGLAAVEDHDPDVIMCDLHMPGIDGLSVIQRLKERGVRTPVVVLSLDKDVEAMRKAIRAGAHNYVVKTGDEDAIIRAAEAAAAHHDTLKDLDS